MAIVLPPEPRRLTDEVLLDLISDPRVAHIGIDAPFGWPTKYVAAIERFSSDGVWTGGDGKRLEFRETDLHVRSVTGTWPLSASTSWLVWPTMRCARLLNELEEWNPAVRRGDRRLLEVYPAAALQVWGVSPASAAQDPGSYKGEAEDRRARRKRLVEIIAEECSQLDLDGQHDRFAESDDELDALIAALVARLAGVGQLEPVPDESLPVAAREGWIRLPQTGGACADVFR